MVRVADTMPDGHVVTLTWSHDMEMAAVTMPVELQAPAGQSLAVWVRHAGNIRKAGMYEPNKTYHSRLLMPCQKMATTSSLRLNQPTDQRSQLENRLSRGRLVFLMIRPIERALRLIRSPKKKIS